MRIIGVYLASALLAAAFAVSAAADPWKDESGHGKWQGSYQRGADNWRSGGDYPRFRGERRTQRDFRGEYRPRGVCKVERKWDGDEYKEEWRCRGGARPPMFGNR